MVVSMGRRFRVIDNLGMTIPPATLDVRPEQVVTLNAWGGPLADQIKFVSSRARFPLMRFSIPEGTWRAWLYLHVVWRSQERMMHCDVHALKRGFDELTTHGEFGRDWYYEAPMGDVRLGEHYGTGWFRGEITAAVDYWQQIEDFGCVLLPYPSHATVQYSADQAFVRLQLA